VGVKVIALAAPDLVAMRADSTESADARGLVSG
jgi:hypothetical protein